jgi:phosphocarrier protein
MKMSSETRSSEPLPEVERELTVRSANGLHVRPVSMLVEEALRFRSEIRFERDGRTACGKSPLEMMMLAAPHGAKVRVFCRGEDASDAMDALAALFERRFGED